MVRRLALGHRPAGFYRSRGRAAHWDGRNQIGEKVATGLYFCTFTAGEFTATGKNANPKVIWGPVGGNSDSRSS